MESIKTAFILGGGGYLALTVLFFVTWGLSFVINTLWIMFDAWVAGHPINPKHLQVKFHKIVDWWALPIITPLLLIGLVIYAFCGLLDTLHIIYTFRVKPWLTRWKQTYTMPTFNLSWLNLTSLSDLLNRIIGQGTR